MARNNGIYLTFASICLLSLCHVAVSQTTPPQNLPVSCQDATAATVNGTLLLGTWYEAARKPVGGGVNSENCVQMILDYDNGTVTAEVTYSLDPSALWVNQTINNTVLYNGTDGGSNPEVFTAVFNITSGGVNTTFKILDTDYTSYAFICGYIPIAAPVATTTVAPSSTTTTSPPSSTNAPSSSTTTAPVNLSPAGAFIITRQRQINSTVLANLTADALATFSDFNNISAVIQSNECWEVSGASTTVPALAMVMVIVYSLLKLVQ